MKALKIIGLVGLVFLLSNELANVYEQIGWDAIFIIIPLAVIAVGVIYFRRRKRKYKDKI